MKNLKKISELSKQGRTPIYYSPKTDTVYTEAGEGRFYITDLLRSNTPKEIERTVSHIMSL